MNFYPSTANVEGFIYYEDRQNFEFPINEKIPIIGYLFKENGFENHTLKFNFLTKDDPNPKVVLYEVKTKVLHSPDELTIIPDYCDIVMVSAHKYVIILSILQAGLMGEIFKSYKIVGTCSYLPDEIEFLSLI